MSLKAVSAVAVSELWRIVLPYCEVELKQNMSITQARYSSLQAPDQSPMYAPAVYARLQHSFDMSVPLNIGIQK